MVKQVSLVVWAAGSALIAIAAAALAQAPVEPSKTPSPAAARPQLPPGQVFECVNGSERTFSDAPCGAHATIRQLNDLNVMDAPAAPSVNRSYAPAYRPPAAEPVQYPDDNPPEIVSDPAVATQIIVVRPRLRREHFPTHVNRPHPQPRRN